MKAWRIEKRRRAAAVTTGEGGRIAGGRWNSPGLPVVYASEHLSLAILEILVHAPAPEQRIVPRSRTEIDIPDTLVEVLRPKRLPDRFGPGTPYAETQAIGDEWLAAKRTVALVVPSAIVPAEHNILLNPAHPDFAKVTWGAFETIALDARLWSVPGPAHGR